ncbi:hypothetical protein D3C73_1331970 [compost metagenome]
MNYGNNIKTTILKNGISHDKFHIYNSLLIEDIYLKECYQIQVETLKHIFDGTNLDLNKVLTKYFINITESKNIEELNTNKKVI